MTASKIYLGITVQTDAAAGNAALGAAGISQGDQRANFNVLIADVNGRGGVAGHRLEPVYWELDSTSTKTYEQLDQEACTAFTQDHKTLLVFGPGITDSFPRCIENAGGTMLSTGGIIDPDDQTFRDLPDLYDIAEPSQERMMREQARSLQRLDYFSGWDARRGQAATSSAAKVGILYLDTPKWTRPMNAVLLPALKAAGHPAADSDVIGVPLPADTSEFANFTAAIQSAVLRFRSDGVTHVILLDASGTITLIFAQSASTQGFRPRLGANTATGMQALYDSGNIPPAQLRGAVGLAWKPSIDLPQAAAAKYVTPQGARCLSLLKSKTGQALATANERTVALANCEFINFAGTLLGHSRALNRPALRDAVAHLGRTYAPTSTASSYFSSQRHDGLSTGYDMVWDGSCNCAKYVRELRIP